jgi:hypothetical protein
MTVNQSYEEFIMRTVRTQYYPRSLSEAFRDADYGTAIWRCESPNEKGTNVLVWVSVLILFGVVIGLFVAPLLS